jgi:hypothetical protein
MLGFNENIVVYFWSLPLWLRVSWSVALILILVLLLITYVNYPSKDASQRLRDRATTAEDTRSNVRRTESHASAEKYPKTAASASDNDGVKQRQSNWFQAREVHDLPQRFAVSAFLVMRDYLHDDTAVEEVRLYRPSVDPTVDSYVLTAKFDDVTNKTRSFVFIDPNVERPQAASIVRQVMSRIINDPPSTPMSPLWTKTVVVVPQPLDGYLDNYAHVYMSTAELIQYPTTSSN